MELSGELVDEVRARVGPTVSEDVIKFYLIQSGYEVAGAVEAFFDAQQVQSSAKPTSERQVKVLIRQMKNVLGPKVPDEAARFYLRKADYDSQTAIQFFLDAQTAEESQVSTNKQHKSKSNPRKRKPVSKTRKRKKTNRSLAGAKSSSSSSSSSRGRSQTRQLLTLQYDSGDGKEIKNWVSSSFLGSRMLENDEEDTIRFSVANTSDAIRDKIQKERKRLGISFFYVIEESESRNYDGDNEEVLGGGRNDHAAECNGQREQDEKSFEPNETSEEDKASDSDYSEFVREERKKNKNKKNKKPAQKRKRKRERRVDGRGDGRGDKTNRKSTSQSLNGKNRDDKDEGENNKEVSRKRNRETDYAEQKLELETFGPSKSEDGMSSDSNLCLDESGQKRSSPRPSNNEANVEDKEDREWAEKLKADMNQAGYSERTINAAVGSLLKDQTKEEAENSVGEQDTKFSAITAEPSKEGVQEDRTNENVEAGIHYQRLLCFMCSASIPGKMTICESFAEDKDCREDAYGRDGYTSLCPEHVHIIGLKVDCQKIADLHKENRRGSPSGPNEEHANRGKRRRRGGKSYPPPASNSQLASNSQPVSVEKKSKEKIDKTNQLRKRPDPQFKSGHIHKSTAIFANGVRVGQICYKRTNGEFEGLAIRALECAPSLITDRMIKKAAEDIISGSDVQEICRELGHSDPSTLEALIAWYFRDVTKKPMKNSHFQNERISGTDFDRLLKATDHKNHCYPNRSKGSPNGKTRGRLAPNCVMCRCQYQISSPVSFPFVIESVAEWMPQEWVGKEFASGWDLHLALDELPARVGRPPTCFASTYSMTIHQNHLQAAGISSLSLSRQLEHNNTEVAGTLRLLYDQGSCSLKLNLIPGFDRVQGDDDYVYRLCNAAHLNLPNPGAVVIGVCGFPSLDEKDAPDDRKDTPSLWASQLQKSMRRGKGCELALIEAIDKLIDKCRTVHRPELQFAACSGTRQLLWRAYICILEDIAPFRLTATAREHGLLSLAEIGALALAAHANPKFQMPEPLIVRLKMTLVSLLEVRTVWDWRGLAKDKGIIKNAEMKVEGLEASVRYDVSRILLQGVPCMSGDLKLQLASLLIDDTQNAILLEVSNTASTVRDGKIPQMSDASRGAQMAAIDFHCFPWLILELQANLPHVPSAKHTTVCLSKKIWELSSSKNGRFKKAVARVSKGDQELLEALQQMQEWIRKCKNVNTRITREGIHKINGGNMDRDRTMVPCTEKLALYKPKGQSRYINRAAFVSIFGRRMVFKEQQGSFSAVLAGGSLASPVKLQLGVSNNAQEGENPYRYISGETYESTLKLYVERMSKGVTIPIVQPPNGLVWRWDVIHGSASKARKTVRVRIDWNRDSKKGDEENCRLKFEVEGLPIDAFDASSVLSPASSVPVVKVKGWLVSVLEAAVYANGSIDKIKNGSGGCELQMFKGLPMLDVLYKAGKYMREVWCKKMRRNYNGQVPVFVWFLSARLSALPKCVWRDLLAKLATREQNYVDIAPCGRDGKRQTNVAVRYQTEGTMLRLMSLMAVLYPTVVRPQGRLRFKINDTESHYMHMFETLQHLSFPPQKKQLSKTSPPSIPKIKTKLWPHQQSTAQRVLEGVKEGRRGFADASTVGAGKTLSAIATMVTIANYWKESKTLHGFLVLVPNIRLINEWTEQIEKHATGFEVVIQQANGSLIKKHSLPSDRNQGKQAEQKWRESGFKANQIVISTLGRARDHPFSCRWTFVVIDECTSVQNESALQTAEAWRQAVSSDAGILMLSATFFRARFSKLFYMIRMLQSPIPRSMPFLNALLAEHVICHVPDVKRHWEVKYIGVPLPGPIKEKYEKILSRRHAEDSKLVYSKLKQLLHRDYDAAAILKSEAEKFMSQQRRPLIFVNSKLDKQKVTNLYGGSLPRDAKVLTVHEGAHGLNMQFDCDCIVTRPHPGDIMEQMKGRIDRPGQKQEELHLHIVYAENTIEAVEAANVRICGRFVMQYLNPLSEQFCQAALDGKDEMIRKGFESKIKGKL